MFGFLGMLGNMATDLLVEAGSSLLGAAETTGGIATGTDAGLAAGTGIAAGTDAGLAAGTAAAETELPLLAKAADTGKELINGPKDFFAQTWQNAKDDLGQAWDDVAVKNPDGSTNGWKTAGNIGYKTAKSLVMGVGNAALSGGGGQKQTQNVNNAENALHANQSATENGQSSFQTGNQADEELKRLMSKMQQV